MAVKEQVAYFTFLYMKFVMYETQPFSHKTNWKIKIN